MPQQPGWLTAPTPLERAQPWQRGTTSGIPIPFMVKRCCIAASPVPNGNGHTASRGSRDVWGVGRLLQDGATAQESRTASSRLHEPRHRDDDVLRDEQTRTFSQKAQRVGVQKPVDMHDREVGGPVGLRLPPFGHLFRLMVRADHAAHAKAAALLCRLRLQIAARWEPRASVV